jgi:hypothetical protein
MIGKIVDLFRPVQIHGHPGFYTDSTTTVMCELAGLLILLFIIRRFTK